MFHLAKEVKSILKILVKVLEAILVEKTPLIMKENSVIMMTLLTVMVVFVGSLDG